MSGGGRLATPLLARCGRRPPAAGRRFHACSVPALNGERDGAERRACGGNASAGAACESGRRATYGAGRSHS
ncbi:hypothetical protein EVAR_69435_1 [Eumeta japonica]|uniref:Uncharacterized protein n=1 Tax=Eumeta variegata TaxID=151549 RepID=A0A4C2AAF4_EUMVA|nr:hypothetical protein EVAR_69435_1 [Eumeta japonica]